MYQRKLAHKVLGGTLRTLGPARTGPGGAFPRKQLRWPRPERPGGPTTPAPRRGHPRQTKPSAALRGVAGGRRRAPGRGGPPRSMRAHTRAGPHHAPRAPAGRPRRVPREHARRAPGPAPPGRPSRSGGNLKAPARAGRSRRVALPPRRKRRGGGGVERGGGGRTRGRATAPAWPRTPRSLGPGPAPPSSPRGVGGGAGRDPRGAPPPNRQPPAPPPHSRRAPSCARAR